MPRTTSLASCLAPPIPGVARVSGAAPGVVPPRSAYTCDGGAGLRRLQRRRRQDRHLPQWPRAEWLLPPGDVGLLGMRHSSCSGRRPPSARAVSPPARTQLVKTGQREGAVGVGGIWLADPLSPGPRIALSAETGHLVWRQGHQPAPGAGFLSPFGLPLGPGPWSLRPTCRHLPPPPQPPERLCASSRPRLLPGPQRSAVRRLRPPLVSYGDGVSHQMALSASGFRPQAARASTAWKNSHGMAFDQRGDEAAGDMLPS